MIGLVSIGVAVFAGSGVVSVWDCFLIRLLVILGWDCLATGATEDLIILIAVSVGVEIPPPLFPLPPEFIFGRDFISTGS